MTDYPRLDSATLLEIYRRAALIKINDELTIQTIKAGKISIPYYSPRGQEIIPSAVSVSLTDDDTICTIYRGIHDMLAKGLPLDLLWAELAGRVTGTCKGKGGPMHLTYPEKGLMVTTGVVGASIPLANGLAWDAQLEGEGRVSIAYFGDGAANIGAFHEGLNLAGVWKLPVVFICQNNGYAEHTTFADSTAAARLSDRALGYGMPGVTVDGNDPDAMHAAARTAIERARKGEGPTFIEAMTYRFNGHVFGDAGHYMDAEEKAQARLDDPVPLLRQRLIDEGAADEATLAALEADIAAQVTAAIESALAAPYPDLIELKRDVYAEELSA